MFLLLDNYDEITLMMLLIMIEIIIFTTGVFKINAFLKFPYILIKYVAKIKYWKLIGIPKIILVYPFGKNYFLPNVATLDNPFIFFTILFIYFN